MAFSNVRAKLVSTLQNISKMVFPWNLLNRSHTSKPPTLVLHGKKPKGSAFLLGCRSFATVPFVGNLERIPYSRKFCLLSSIEVEEFKRMSEIQNRDFEEKKWEWSVLPWSDWRVRRVESVARKIIAAMNDGLMLDKAYKINGKVYEPSHREICEQRILTWKPVTKHLNGKEWEFYVAEDMSSPSYCGSCGKIIVNAKFLDREAVIATLVGYEIGKFVAKVFWRWEFMGRFNFRLQKSTAIIKPVSVILGVTGKLLECFRLRRNFAEACYIGLLLMASAGYDPRVAPLVHRHFASLCQENDGWFSTLYSGDKIAKLLERKEVMKEAIEIYEEVEAEASHVGLTLMASAGYYSRVAPVIYRYIYKIKDALFSPHYSGDKIAKFLKRNQAMKEGIEIYEEIQAVKGLESLFR